MNETRRLPGQEVAICPRCSSPIPVGRASSCLPGVARLLQPRSSSQLSAFPWGLSSQPCSWGVTEGAVLAALAPRDAANVATLLKKQREIASPGKELAFQSPACASIPVFLVLAGEGNATCPAHPLRSKRYTCLASWLESYPCTAALQRCWCVEDADGQESEGRAGEMAWKWLGWGFSW